MKLIHLKKVGHEYIKSIFDSEAKMVCNIDNNQKVNQDFKVGAIKYQLDAKHVDDLLLHDTTVNSKHQDPPQCKVDLTEVKQLQGQDMHLSKAMAKCKSWHHHDKTPHHLDECGIVYRKVWDG